MSQAPSGNWRTALSIIKWVIALSIVGWLVYQNREQFQQLRTQSIQWEFLIAAFLLCGGSIILTFYRWYLLVVALDFPFRFSDALRLGFLGCLFNYVAPGSVGGDLVKAVVMAREQKARRSAAVATILLDRILGMLGLLIIGAGATLVSTDTIDHRETVVAILWGGTVAGLVGLIVMLHPSTPNSWWMKLLIRIPKAGAIIADIADGISLYQRRRVMVALTVVLSIIGHFGLISSFYCCARVVGTAAETPGFVTQLLLFPLAEIVGAVVALTPGGVGVLEGAVQAAYKMAGANPALGLLAIGAYRISQIIVAVIGSFYYLASRRQIQEMLADELAEPAEADLTDESQETEQPSALPSGTTSAPES